MVAQFLALPSGGRPATSATTSKKFVPAAARCAHHLPQTRSLPITPFLLLEIMAFLVHDNRVAMGTLHNIPSPSLFFAM
jgi:hypothetical protein